MTRVVGIDPGHGGADPGVTVGDLVESRVNLQVALQLRRALLGTGWCGIGLTREEDVACSLADRGRSSAAAEASLVLSLHCNAITDPTIDGIMGFHWPCSATGREVSEAILRAAPADLRRLKAASWAATDDPGEQDDWLRRSRAVLAPHKATAVLIEMGFASSPRDRALLLDPAVQASLVAACLCGVARALEIIR